MSETMTAAAALATARAGAKAELSRLASVEALKSKEDDLKGMTTPELLDEWDRVMSIYGGDCEGLPHLVEKDDMKMFGERMKGGWDYAMKVQQEITARKLEDKERGRYFAMREKYGA